MHKELWIEEYDRAYNQALDRGLSPKEADSVAERAAETNTRERFADMIDHARLLRKEGRI